ncbi:hypothetical protein OAB94_00880 [Flavobacteriaceae bacterium]|nr:hypothetical protein [Flavobacteriaceae bacterium]
MSKELKKLQATQKELETKVDAMQTEAAEKLFVVNLEDKAMIKTMMDHLDKSYTWKTQNAAIVVTLFDTLKARRKELASDAETTEATVSLRGHELNGLYQALLNCEGTGVENARRFITMLTMVGQTVGEAMQELSALNETIKAAHTELAEAEKAVREFGLEVEKVEATLEPVK